jgi:peptidoglycan/LPS O-acetylase OafA/YrhL
MWMLPGAFRDFSQSLVAVAFFASNILFARERGYFAAASDEKPLLHTWSLAVEEQYYVIFPILLILLWRFGRNPTLFVLAALAFASFLLSEFPQLRNPSQHFFFSPARAWELLAGSFCAFAVANGPIRPNNWLSLLGLGLIGYSIFWFAGKTPFPSAYTLAPVMGTVLLVLFCTSQTWVGKILSHRLPVGIGLISYSLYLWHQPLFAFARIRLELPPSQILMSGLIAVLLFSLI